MPFAACHREKHQHTPMSSSPSPPHVLLVSAPLQGHVNPLLVLGRRLASRGLLVTFSTVPHAGLKFPHGDGASVAVGRGTLRFEHLRGGSLWAPDDPCNDPEIFANYQNHHLKNFSTNNPCW